MSKGREYRRVYNSWTSGILLKFKKKKLKQSIFYEGFEYKSEGRYIESAGGEGYTWARVRTLKTHQHAS